MASVPFVVFRHKASGRLSAYRVDEGPNTGVWVKAWPRAQAPSIYPQEFEPERAGLRKLLKEVRAVVRRGPHPESGLQVRGYLLVPTMEFREVKFAGMTYMVSRPGPETPGTLPSSPSERRP